MSKRLPSLYDLPELRTGTVGLRNMRKFLTNFVLITLLFEGNLHQLSQMKSQKEVTK